jgi:hypothetical protein
MQADEVKFTEIVLRPVTKTFFFFPLTEKVGEHSIILGMLDKQLTY